MAGEYELDRVVRERHFAEVTSGVLIEVGAAGPNYLSIAETFRAAGWQRVKVRTLDTILATHRPILRRWISSSSTLRDGDSISCADFPVSAIAPRLSFLKIFSTSKRTFSIARPLSWP